MTENQNDLITITAGELMDRQFLPRHTVVENFLPAGTFILSGQPKIGKSFLMLMLCWCVSEGKPFLGFETRQSEVLISQGTDVVTVSKMLGHAKVSTTEDIYSHVIEESKQQASNALAEVYSRRKAAEN